MKSFLRAAAATGVAAATVVTGLSFGPAAMAAPETRSLVDGTQFQLIIPSGNGYKALVDPNNYNMVDVASIEEARKQAVTFTVKSAGTIDGAQYWSFGGSASKCIGARSDWYGYVAPIAAAACDGSEKNGQVTWTLENGLPRTEKGRYLTSDLSRKAGGDDRLKWSTERPTSENFRFINTPFWLGATVSSLDLVGKTAKLDGFAPNDVSSVEVSYTDSTGAARQFTPSASAGKWSQAIDKLQLGNNKVTLRATEPDGTVIDNTVDVDLTVPAVKLVQANRYVKDGATKYAYQVSGGVKGATLQGKAKDASGWDDLGTIDADGTAYITDTDKGATSGDYLLREVFESTPSAETTVAQSAIVKDKLPKVQVVSATTFTSGSSTYFSYTIKGVPGSKVQDGPTGDPWGELGTIPASGVLNVYSSTRGPAAGKSWDFRQYVDQTFSEKVTIAASDYKPTPVGATVKNVDVEAGTADLDGFAPGNATDVAISYTNKDGATRSKNAKVVDAVWSKELDLLALGKTEVKLVAYEGSEVVAENTVEVDLPVTALTGTPAFADDVQDVATVTGTATPETQISAFHGESTKPVATTMSNAKGEYVLPINPPGVGGTYDLTITQKIRGEDTSPLPITLDYGQGVEITGPAQGEPVEAGEPLFITGKTQAGTMVQVTEKGVPDKVLGQANAGQNGTYRVQVPKLQDREYTLVVSAQSKGANVTSAELLVNRGKSDVTNPTANVTFDADVTKKATVSGTGAKGAVITVKNGTDPIASATVADDGTWSTQIDPIGAGSYELTIEQTGIEGTQTTNATADFGAAVTANTPTATVDSTLATVTGRGEPGATITLRDDTGKTRTTTIGDDGTWSVQGNFRPDTTQVTVTAQSKGALKTTVAAKLDIKVNNRPLVITSPTQDDAKADKITAGKVTFTGTATPFSTVQLRTWPEIGRVLFTTYADENGNWSATGELGSTYYELAGKEIAVGGYVDNIRMFAFSTVAFQDTVITSPTAKDVILAGPDNGVVFTGTATPGATVEIWTWINPRGRMVAKAQADGLGNWKTNAGYLTADNVYKLKAEQIALNGKTTVTELGDLQTESFHTVDQIERDQNGSTTNWTLRATPGATVEIWTGPKTTTWARKIGSGTADKLGKVTINGTYLTPGNGYMTKIYQITATKEEVTDYNFATDPA